MWVDIGVNLTNKRFSADLDDVLQRASQAGVQAMLVTGTSVTASEQALKLAQKYPGCLRATAGVHPHDASAWDSSIEARIRQLAESGEVVAVGETGLDFNRNFSSVEDQERAFLAQLDLAMELALPVFLHQRDAHQRFMQLLKPHLRQGLKAVVHCFTGSRNELEECLAEDMHIGITGWICDERRGTELQEIVSLIPAGRLMLETDAPYLVPRDLRPKPKSNRNEPAFLPHIAEAVARCRQEPLMDLAEHTTATAKEFFGFA